MPHLHIITGSNGAGKSSVGPSYLPENIQATCEVFDGDKLFLKRKRELWESGSKAHKENKKIAFQEVTDTFDALVEASLNQNTDFVYEGHFTNESTWEIPRKFKNSGFAVHMIFFGLTDTNLSELRVIDRVKEGGHHVDPAHISANFYGNLEKLNEHYAMFDTLQIIDTSETKHKVLCILENNTILSSVSRSELPDWFIKHLPNLAARIQ